ncbi:MAG: ATP-grasp domain-containing protein [Gloeocapsa sp. UFS-A4-WI-NPMV-4B04]|jgi:predicted ATP-grasp superfamily ATP-dependent carboligase|nr:ATP-grasp domain-containing protein [Gloeocapsa sp. UFS-A4-WI-NPMV-4B04]
MQIKQPSVLIPDHCNNFLVYYVIRSLKEASSDFKINVIVPSDHAPTDKSWLIFYKHSRYINNLIFSENEVNSIEYLNEIIEIIENTGIDIVFPATDVGFKFVAEYRDQLSNFCKVVASPSHDALHTALDKWSLHLFLNKHNIPVPKTILLREIEQFNQFNYPILLKPINGSGGENIQKFDTLEQANFQFIFNDSREAYIVQDYIVGYDIGCNVLCQNGQIIAYTIQELLGIEGGFAPKINKLKFVHNSAFIDIVARTMQSLQWSGVANLDLRYNSKTGQLNVLEINPRFWQSLMGSVSIGVNFPYLLYLLSSGISFEPVSYQEKYYAKIQRFIKDALNGSLEYSLSDTNIKYLLTDPNSVFQFMLYRFLKKIVFLKNYN